jgi:hypothetical protein
MPVDIVVSFEQLAIKLGQVVSFVPTVVLNSISAMRQNNSRNHNDQPRPRGGGGGAARAFPFLSAGEEDVVGVGEATMMTTLPLPHFSSHGGGGDYSSRRFMSQFVPDALRDDSAQQLQAAHKLDHRRGYPKRQSRLW